MKITLLDTMKTERLSNKLWMLMSDFRVVVDGETITVPAGFITDGASVPRAFWMICPPVAGPFGEAALVHDFLYSNKSKCDDRKFADTVLREIGRKNGANLLRALAVYSAVRSFGWRRFKR